MTGVKCSVLLGKNEFDTISEFIFVMCMAKELHRRGYVLDMTGISLERIVLTKDYDDWFCYLQGTGVVWTGRAYSGRVVAKEPKRFEFDMGLITRHVGDLFEEVITEGGDSYYRWSNNWAKTKHYGADDGGLYCVSKLGIILMHLTAHMVVGMMLEDIPKKKVVLYFEEPINHTSDYYAHMVDCIDSLDWLKEYVEVSVEGGMGRFGEDADFKLFIERGIQSGRGGVHWGIKDKAVQLKDKGIVEGAICIWYERGGQADTNPYGRIAEAHIVRVDEVADDTLSLTVIPLYKTKEEVLYEYSQIPQNDRSMFSDMLRPEVRYRKQVLGMYNVAVSDYIGNEDNIIDVIDKRGSVTKRVRVDGEVKEITMSQIDAIYWLLMEYNAKFDIVLFHRMYKPLGGFLYDKLMM